MKRFAAFWSKYCTAAVILANTILLFVAINALAGLASAPFRFVKYDLMIRNSWPALHRAFPEFSQSDIRELMREDLRVGELVYAPWLQFRVPSLTGRFINTDGPRRSNGLPDGWQSAMPDSKHTDVYFFGGSTMFGYGVADKDTLPARFQRLAPASWNVRAFNYGQPYYYSRQETLLFEQLLRNGHHPKVAVFMDGLNDTVQPLASYRREPFFTPLLERRVSSPIDWQSVLLDLNLTHVLKNFGVAPSDSANLDYGLPTGVPTPRVVDALAGGYLENLAFTQKLCDLYKVRCLFVWQPVPMVHYHRPQDTLSSQQASPLQLGVYAAIALRTDIPQLLDLQNSLDEFPGQPFVDGFHYSPGFHAFLADKIIARLQATR